MRAEQSFRELLASLRDRYNYSFGALLLLKALGAWLYGYLKFPQIPLSVLVIYRNAGNDMTYLPIISGLGHAGFHEAFIKEFAGTGVLQFPVFSALPFVIFTKLFGPTGYIVVDVVFLLATFASLVVLFRLLGIGSLVSRCLALLAVTNVFYLMGHIRFWMVSRLEPMLAGHPPVANPTYVFHSALLQYGIPVACALALGAALWVFLTGRQSLKLPAFGFATAVYVAAMVLVGTYFFVIWGWRLPRPLVTGVFFYSALASLVYLIRFPSRTSSVPWIMFGVCWAVLAQSYIYDAFLLGIAASGILIYLILQGQIPNAALVRNLGICALLIVLLCIPIIYQQLSGASPDIFRRYGGFSLNRLSFPHFWPEAPELIELTFSAAIAFMLFRLPLTLVKTGENVMRMRAGIFLVWLVIASLLSLPISVLLLGRTIQVGHFLDEYYEMLSLGIAVLVAYCADVLLTGLVGLPYSRHLSLAFLAGACLLSTGAIAIEARRPNVMTNAVRDDFAEYATLNNYRNDFQALVGELQKPRFDNLVLGSLDVQVQSWWVSFAHGYVYLPDVFTTNIPDSEIEMRLITLTKTLGINEDQFMDLIAKPYADIFFLGHAKYMGSPLHTFSPIFEYSAADQAEIRQRSIFSTFVLYMPVHEKARLREKFRATRLADNPREMDLILLSNGESLVHFAPPASEYTLVYRNPTFRLWERSTLIGHR